MLRRVPLDPYRWTGVSRAALAAAAVACLLGTAACGRESAASDGGEYTLLVGQTAFAPGPVPCTLRAERAGF